MVVAKMNENLSIQDGLNPINHSQKSEKKREEFNEEKNGSLKIYNPSLTTKDGGQSNKVP
jgi:hypothetical protein